MNINTKHTNKKTNTEYRFRCTKACIKTSDCSYEKNTAQSQQWETMDFCISVKSHGSNKNNQRLLLFVSKKKLNQ